MYNEVKYPGLWDNPMSGSFAVNIVNTEENTYEQEKRKKTDELYNAGCDDLVYKCLCSSDAAGVSVVLSGQAL